jgi:hypothetical protein
MRLATPGALLCALAMAPIPAPAQPAMQAPPGAQGGTAPPPSGADQLVGLFGATCLHFAGDTAGLRKFLTQEGAPAMPDPARGAFLAGRAGQAFDVSVPGVNLALVSLDDGGCEAVVEHADPAEIVPTLTQSAADAHVAMQSLGATQPDKNGRGVNHAAFLLTSSGKQMHVLVSTAPQPPQAVLTFVPK